MENTTTGRQTEISKSNKTRDSSSGVGNYSDALELRGRVYTELCGEHILQKDAFKPVVTHW